MCLLVGGSLQQTGAGQMRIYCKLLAVRESVAEARRAAKHKHNARRSLQEVYPGKFAMTHI